MDGAEQTGDVIEVKIGMVLPLALAAWHNGVPFLERVAITSRSTHVERDLVLEVTCDGNWFETGRFPLPPLNPDASVEIPTPDLKVDGTRLRDLEEAATTVLRARIVRGDVELAKASTPFRVLAHNEWIATLRRDLIAAFVLPNHPAVTELVAEARDLQQKLFGEASFEGYQVSEKSGDPERVVQQAHALYSALQQRGVTYLGVPPSFESHGQKIRLPESLRRERMGNCIELATWFAAALEACGLDPVIVMIDGHAFSGFRLSESSNGLDVIETDASTVRKLVDSKRLILVESTMATSRPAVAFADACEAARGMIDEATFTAMVDIRLARTAKVRPFVTGDAPVDTTTIGVPVTEFDTKLPDARVPAARARGGKTRTRVDGWVDALLDLTLRNDLLGMTLESSAEGWLGVRTKRKGVILPIPDLAAFENALSDGTRFRLEDGPLTVGTKRDDPRVVEHLGAEMERGVLHPGLGAVDVKLRIRDLWKRHTTGLEEKGVSPIHVALGFLKWFEADGSSQPRFAPLLLVPAAITRDSVGAAFHVEAGDGETVFNGALVAKLRNEFGIDLSALAHELPEEDSGVDVEAVFHTVTEAVLRLKRFEVVRLAMLAPFEYRKQVMAKDLKEIAASTEGAPNEFLAKLAPSLSSKWSPDYYGGGTFTKLEALDDTVPPDLLPLVVDSDSSQLSAVHAALTGKSFVLQGPPGTGKSQTITNMIASLLAAGKRVLFVAEKRAALSVVAHRLGRAELGTACLELHSEKADPGHVSRSLVEALDEVRPQDAGRFASSAQEVAEKRQRLNQFVRRLHAPTPLGKTFYLASARRHALRQLMPPAVSHPNPLETSGDLFERRLKALAALEASIEDCGGWIAHPFRVSRLAVWTEKLESQANDHLSTLEEAAEAMIRAADAAATTLGIPHALVEAAPTQATTMLRLAGEAPPRWVRDLAVRPDREDYLTVFQRLASVSERRSGRLTTLGTRWSDGLHDLDLPGLLAEIKTAAPKWAPLRWWALRGPKSRLVGVSKGELPAIDTLIADLELAIAARADAKELDTASQAVVSLMGPAFEGARTPAAVFSRAEDARRWAEAVSQLNRAAREHDLAPVDPKLPVPMLETDVASACAATLEDAIATLSRSAETTTTLLALVPDAAFGVGGATRAPRAAAAFAATTRAALGTLRDKTASEAAAQVAGDLGLGPFIEYIRQGRVPEKGVSDWYEAAFLRLWIDEMVDAHPVLAQFRGREHDRLVDAFRREDSLLLDAGKKKARYDILSRRPPPGHNAHAESDVGLLRREHAKKRRRLPVRRLLKDLEHLVPKLKPCFLMSPLAVSHFLPVDCAKFDTVIFDEASQVKTADAIGALWRGRQVIVVGDSKQMPPTDFFSVGIGDDDEPATDIPEDTESILDEATVSGVPGLMLTWHYRSRDERLIAFSNFNYYDGKLLTFPAADPAGEGCGLEYIRTAGVYDMGKARRNQVEAERVVSMVVERLRDPARRDRSIGIVTFNTQQQDLIETLLEAERKKLPEIEPYFNASAPEPLFVKNLENVQGDERDVMIFSTTFGRDALGRLSMNFGPMNKAGGERRLNVAVTRARERLVVVTSMDPEDIDLTRSSAIGIKHLRDFLAYARDGRRALLAAVSASASAVCESPFELDVLAVCESLGWRVDCQVGCSGYRIDLAARDPQAPGRHVLAIECDGATYHSGATARDRDRLRQSVLEGLGWRFHRIWSTDWRLNRETEIERLKKAYKDACDAPRRPPGRGANRELRSEAHATQDVIRSAPTPVATVPIKQQAPTIEAVDPKAVTDAMRRDAILAVLQEGGTMPREALIKAAANRVGHQRVGTRIKDAFAKVVDGLLSQQRLVVVNDRIALK